MAAAVPEAADVAGRVAQWVLHTLPPRAEQVGAPRASASSSGSPRRRWTAMRSAHVGIRKSRREGTALRKAPAWYWLTAMKRTASRLATPGSCNAFQEPSHAA